jgi:hypothetical protein
MRSQVWYIEARICNDGEFAAEDAASMGSGVLVEIARRDAPSEARRYLLTCAHVVRRKIQGSGDWGGAAYDEILCWRPGQGYTRSYPGKRRCGEHPDIYRARISALSPCGGRKEELPADLRDETDDWVLLEFEDPAFQAEGRPLRWGDIDDDAELHIVGYPGGAGLSKHAAGTRIWGNGSIVENLATGPFSQHRTPRPGMLSLSGADESRPGMSGGGIFNRSGALVGLHRAADDMAMQRNAISIAHIRDFLDTRRNAFPTLPETDPVVRRWMARLPAAVALLGLLGAGAWHFARARDCSLQIRVQAKAGQASARVIDAERANGVTQSALLPDNGATVLELRQMKSWERWQLSLRFEERSSSAIDLKGCPATSQDHELEEAHVRIDPT